MFKTVRIKSLLLFVSILGSLTLSAQDQNVTDAELTQFADAYMNVQVQNQEIQGEIMTLIEQEGLEVERFSQIQQASMNPNATSDATAEEIKKHATISAKIEKMQPELEKKAVKSIEATGISIERFEALASVIQEEAGLQQRLQAILLERQKN